MTDVVILQAAARSRQAWKNGGGVTTEIIAHPAGSGLDDFDWRISIAEIAQAGTFSNFDGIDRILTILEGTLNLKLADADPLQLDPGSDPLAFAGDIPVAATPVTPLVRDLNVMTRRGRYRAVVERLTLAGSEGITRALPAASLLLASRPAKIEIAGRVVALTPLDAIFLAAAGRISIAAGPPSELVLVALAQESRSSDHASGPCPLHFLFDDGVGGGDHGRSTCA